MRKEEIWPETLSLSLAQVLERPRAPTEEGTPEAAPWTGATLARLARKADFVPLGPSASFIKLT